MAQAPAIYVPGHIVKVHLDESLGGGKIRWMLVLSGVQSDDKGSFYLCVAITTTFPDPPAANNVLLPWHPEGSVSTGLRKRSAVVLDWVRRIPPEGIIQKDGYVTNRLLQQILKSLEDLGDASKS